MLSLKPNGMFFRQHGFTLVELLVVIAIIALLLAILMPSLNRARDQAYRIVCSNHLKNIGLAAHFYAEDNSGYLPGRGFTYAITLGSPCYVNLIKYLPSEEHFKCPKDKNDWYDIDIGGIHTSYDWNANELNWRKDRGRVIWINKKRTEFKQYYDVWLASDKSPYHFGKFCVVYLDGHVAQTPKWPNSKDGPWNR